MAQKLEIVINGVHLRVRAKWFNVVIIIIIHNLQTKMVLVINENMGCILVFWHEIMA